MGCGWLSQENENQVRTALGGTPWGPEEWGWGPLGSEQDSRRWEAPLPPRPVKFRVDSSTHSLVPLPPVSPKRMSLRPLGAPLPAKAHGPNSRCTRHLPVTRLFLPLSPSTLSPPLLSTRCIYLFTRMALI